MPKILKRATVKAPLIKGTPLYYPDAVGLKYWSRLAPIFNSMTRETEAEVKALFESPAAHWAGLPTQDASISELSKELIARLLKKYLRIFDRDLGDIVLRMMMGVDKSSAASLAGSLSKMGESLTISPDYFVASMGETFKALTTQNVALFKTIAEQHFAKVETAVMDSIISGNGLKDLNPFFESHSTGEKNYAKTRSMDQTRKAYQSVNLARMRKLGIKKFEWLHSGGSNEPRILHMEMNGKIYEIDNPPYICTMYGVDIYGFPGEAINCRCMIRPVIEFDDDDE